MRGLLGVGEGGVPASIQDDSILDFHDREILRQAGMKFENAIETARKEVAKEYAQQRLEYKPSEPDPDALDYREELGEKLTELVERFR